MKKCLIVAGVLMMVIGIGCSDMKQTFFEGSGERMNHSMNLSGEMMNNDGMHDGSAKADDEVKLVIRKEW